MAEFVLETVLGNLNSLVQKEFGLFLGFDQDLERLASMFTTIKATLEDAEEKQFSDRAIKDWLRKLKDAAHILDDIIDECNYEALRLEYQGVKCACGPSDKVQCSCLSSFHPKHVVFRYKIAKRMKRISERLINIAQERTMFHLTDMVSQKRSGVTDWRLTTSSIIEPKVYGREEDMNKIVEFLIGDASHFEDLLVYPIIGLGGLGKTTLAQLIFNDDRVVNHFELRIWVCVSEDFSFKRMTKAIIEAISKRACEDLDPEPLKTRLQDLLGRKRYLLVLDDVWDDKQENWQRLKPVLACGAKGASILVTTRLPTVASIMGTMPSHELSVLSKNDCWELFKHRAFGPNEEEQAELMDIGKEIVKKCGGVPLAAKAVGGLLRFKRTKNEWLNVKQSNLLELSHDENSIMSVLRLSYLNLPINLRQCFAYCAIFPKDEMMEKQFLIDLWKTNGFISSNERLDLEDVGDGVWNELYWRSFFQDIEKDKFGKVIRFKMHDLFHDLAQSVAEDVCCLIEDHDVTALSERIHHLSNNIWRSSWKAINSIQLHQVKSLRSYICYNVIDQPSDIYPLHFRPMPINIRVPTREADQIFPYVLKSYSLWVLHYEGRNKLSSSIGQLKHIRYLNLCWGYFKTLPESLGKLLNLQILKLDHCNNLKKLPNNLIGLKALEKLSLDGCSVLSSLPPHVGKLTSLRNLTTYFVGKEKGFHLVELGPLKLKGGLKIKHMEKVKSVMDARDANMSSKQLNELTLSWDKNEESEVQENVEEIVEMLQPDTQQLESLNVRGYRGAHFPQWISSPSIKQLKIWEWDKFNVTACPTYLEYLEICQCKEVEGLCEALQHMTFLKELTLESLPNLKSLPDNFGNLSLLHSLNLLDLPKLESLPDCFEKLPLLHYLSIAYCSKLMSLPMSLTHSNLKALFIYRCPELKKRCQKETGEDWPKISHIPSIDFSDLVWWDIRRQILRIRGVFD